MSRRDDKLTGPQCAALLGVQPGTWRRWTTPNRSRGGAVYGPAPDSDREPCSCPCSCKWWYRGTALDWDAGRDRRD